MKALACFFTGGLVYSPRKNSCCTFFNHLQEMGASTQSEGTRALLCDVTMMMMHLRDVAFLCRERVIIPFVAD